MIFNLFKHSTVMFLCRFCDVDICFYCNAINFLFHSRFKIVSYIINACCVPVITGTIVTGTAASPFA